MTVVDTQIEPGWLSRVDFGDGPNDCWLWLGPTSRAGYGRVSYKGKSYGIHRVSYEHFVEPIPEGLEIDHLCRVRNCLRPDHLEPVSHQENVRRGGPFRRKTHCPQDHPYDEENTRWYRGAPHCRACDRLRRELPTVREDPRPQVPTTDDPSPVPHGTVEGYLTWWCHCRPCTRAHRESKWT